MTIPHPDEIVRRTTERLLRNRIVQNNVRGEIVETIVAAALGETWTHCAANWSAWDFRGSCGTRIQVKQSAAAQTWDPPNEAGARRRSERSTGASFDIKAKDGYYKDDGSWVDHIGRHADVFVFAWHGKHDHAADHRDPSQWEFYVVAESALPSVDGVTLVRLRKQVPAVAFAELRVAVESCAALIRREGV